MRLLLKISLTVVSLLVAIVIAAVATEIIYGPGLPALTSNVAFVILIPLWFMIWRPRNRSLWIGLEILAVAFVLWRSLIMTGFESDPHQESEALRDEQSVTGKAAAQIMTPMFA